MSIDLQQLYEKEQHFVNLFEDGEHLDIEMFIGQHISVLGKSGTGKSVTNAVFMEEFSLNAKGIIQLIFDTEGDYYTLKNWRPHKYKIFKNFKQTKQTTIAAKRNKKGEVTEKAKVQTKESWDYKAFDEVCNTILGETKQGIPQPRFSCIILINKYEWIDRLEIIYQILNRLWYQRIEPLYQDDEEETQERKTEAIIVLLDEAHEKIPQSKVDHKLLLKIILDILKKGRKRGFGLMFSSQRPAEVQKTALSQCHIGIFHKVDEHQDIEAYTLRLPLYPSPQEIRSEIWEHCRQFQPGECYFKTSNGTRTKQIRKRKSRHPTKTPGKDALVEW